MLWAKFLKNKNIASENAYQKFLERLEDSFHHLLYRFRSIFLNSFSQLINKKETLPAVGDDGQERKLLNTC